ncbi:MAG: tetratricopeptide repeat protein [Firmicutes bacterium]|nr:tetratricopeptide repeat protein [Bacillota bacterium]
MNNNDEKKLIKLRDKLLKEYKKEKKASVLITSKTILSFYEKNKPEPKDLFYIEDIYNISTIYMKYNMYDFAERYFRKAMEFSKKNAPESKILISICNNLGVCCSKLSRHSLALDMYKKTLEMQFGTNPENKTAIAETFCNIGSACYDMCDYENAIKYHTDALKYRDNKSPNLTLADNYNYIAYDYEACSQQAKACEYAEKAIETIKNSNYPDPNELLSNYYYLAELYEKMKNYSEAIDAYEEAITNIKKIAGEKHPFYAQILLKLSDAYLYVNRPEKALTLRMKSLSIIGEAMGENHIYYANSLKCIADIYLILHNYEKALSYTLREFDIKGNILNKNCDDYLKTALRLCGIYVLCGNNDKAEQILISLISDSNNAESEYYMDIIYYLGKVYLDTTDNEKLYDLFNTAVITRIDLSVNEFIEKCMKAKDKMADLLYNDETNIHIGKSMDINIEKYVDIDSDYSPFGKYGERKEFEEEEFEEEEYEDDDLYEEKTGYLTNLNDDIENLSGIGLDDLESALDIDHDDDDDDDDDDDIYDND